ncbi:DUF2515 family protein [Paenibacillus caui]|uniref:DUF2515 family protein n=1 Tax=Paenibacillus caui TaxID=2873927 RepID=UPI001CA8E180|nr:DUF2515 family protein [Paenibacillus caui]
MTSPDRCKPKKPAGIWLDMLASFPSALWRATRGKAEDLAASGRLRAARCRLDWSEAGAGLVRSAVEDMLNKSGQPRLSSPQSKQNTSADREIAAEIARATEMHNRSNITRTQAYLDIYRAFPELHWALQAHLVSRNAGWNMSDLKGGQEDGLLQDQARYRYYRFLERSNALIFQDAYPQLMLYAQSKKCGKSLFHLLPCFHVSRFMLPFWEQFWLRRSSSLLAVGLIINEQNYIEKRVLQHPFFRTTVMNKPAFRLGSLAGLNQIVIPYALSEEIGPGETEGTGYGQPRVAGRVLADFANLHARIGIGKHLYAILFGLPAVLQGAERFANSVAHTGSRADYWPGLFTAKQEEARTSPEQGAELLRNDFNPAGGKIFSPRLQGSFGDTPYEPITREDWLQQHSALSDISIPRLPFVCEISHGHRLNMLKRAFAHDAAAGARRLRA